MLLSVAICQGRRSGSSFPIVRRHTVFSGRSVTGFPRSPSLWRRTPALVDLAAILQAFDTSWVIMAGWMHVLSEAFLRHFPSRVVNLHPALPGAFPGTDSIQRAYEAYRKGETDHTGVMVHLVPDEAVDAGPVVVKEVVPIRADDALEDLEKRIHAVEHRLLVQAVRGLVC